MSETKKILILTTPMDIHGMAVSWALGQWDIEHDLINFSDFPSRVDARIHVDANGNMRCSFGELADISPETYSVIWDRRGSTPTVSPAAHESDRRFITAESKQFIKNFRSVLTSGESIWINTPAKSASVDNKVLQLSRAAKLGFAIPETLVSNSHRDVTAFVSNRDRTIVKQFCQLQWMSRDHRTTYPTHTVAITEEDIRDPDPVQLCANIFQPALDIEYEVRVTVIGGHAFAAKIDSQMDGPLIDWRSAVARNGLSVIRYELPKDVADRCVEFCQSFGLQFGCIDLIVNRAGDYVFLEINQTGQWLWKEVRDPSIPLLHAFTAHLANLSGKSIGKAPISYERFLNTESYRGLVKTMMSYQDSYDPTKDPSVLLEKAHD